MADAKSELAERNKKARQRAKERKKKYAHMQTNTPEHIHSRTYNCCPFQFCYLLMSSHLHFQSQAGECERV
jgi:hypothetical protein